MDQSNELEKNAGRKELDVFSFLKYLLQKKNILIATMCAGGILSAIYGFFIARPIYEATSQIYLVNSKDSIVNLSDLQVGSYLTSDYQWIFQTWEVNQQVIDDLNLPYNVAYMKKNLEVRNPNNTRVLTITFSSPDAKEAASVANEYAVVASQYIYEALQTSMPSIISSALEPPSPTKPRKILIISIFSGLSLLVAVWVMFIVFLCNDKIRNGDDLQRYLNVAPLAEIPKMSESAEKATRRRENKNGRNIDK